MAECSHRSCVGHRACRAERRNAVQRAYYAAHREEQRAYFAAYDQFRRPLRRMERRIAHKETLIRDLASQLGLKYEESPA